MTPEGLTTLADVGTPTNPFPGLRPFEFGESHLYFGRDGQSDQLIRKLSATRFVAVVGTSGSGKSSAVRQNRMPSNESLLVVVDQFEELFRFARVSASEQYRYEAAAFVKLLLEAARQREHSVYVVLTMRSDFLGDCAQFWDLPEAINEGQYLIPRMTRDQRAEAITGPLTVCGGEITQRLVNRLLNDTGDNPDMLPILQHALMRTWENWAGDHADGEPVDLRHYEAIGTMSAALSQH